MSDAKQVPRLLLVLPILLVSALGLLYWHGLSYDPNRLSSRLVGKPIPTFSLPALHAEDVILRSVDIKGPALINIWASWCAACREEHPLLLQLAKKDGVKIYGIDYQDTADTAKTWLEQTGNPFYWIMFDGAAAVSMPLDIYSLPQTYAIDASGVIRARHVGALTREIWQMMQNKAFYGPDA